MNVVEEMLLRSVQDFWSRQVNQYGRPWQPGMIRRFHRPWPARDALVAELRRDTRFVVARTAAVLLRPDVEVATTVAESVVPTPYGVEIAFVRDLILAAGASSERVRRRAAASAGVVAVGLLLR